MSITAHTDQNGVATITAILSQDTGTLNAYKQITKLLAEAQELPERNYTEVLFAVRDALTDAIRYQKEIITYMRHVDGTPRKIGWG